MPFVPDALEERVADRHLAFMTLTERTPPAPRGLLRTTRVDSAWGRFGLSHVRHQARRFAPHFFSTYAVGVVESGECCVTTPRGSWIAGPGSLVAFAPGEAHWAEVTSDDAYSYRMAYLSPDCMRALRLPISPDGEEVSYELTPVMGPSECSTAFLAAHRALLDDPDSATAPVALLANTKAMLREATGRRISGSSTRDLSLVDTAKSLLSAHIGQRIVLDTVAEACGVTSFHLIRVFRRVTGFSPYSYLIVLRVNEARRLLDAGASVSEAIYSCCFSDQSHLTRVFKRTLGVPPGLYLRATR